jgi:hypothetical protein
VLLLASTVSFTDSNTENVLKVPRTESTESISCTTVSSRRDWDVKLLENGQPLVSRQCDNEAIARYVAEAAKKELVRTGWAMPSLQPSADRPIPRNE